MFGSLSLFASRTSRLCVRQPKFGTSKPLRARNVSAINIRSFTSLSASPLVSRTALIVSKPVKYTFIQKRGHAECGMPHGGDEAPGAGMERELRAHLNVTELIVEDTSGNGSFYYVEVESPDFKGKSTLACHKMVQTIIAKQIEHIHGLRIKTSVPKDQ